LNFCLSPPPLPTPFPYTTLFRSSGRANRSICRLGLKAPSDSRPDRETRGPYAANPAILDQSRGPDLRVRPCAFLNAPAPFARSTDRKSTRLNSSHVSISYAVSCL